MSFDIALALLQDGLIAAAVYTLLAVALILVFSVTRIIFIPQGELVTYAALSIAAMEAGRVPATLYLLLAAGGAVVLVEFAAYVAGRRAALRSALWWGAALPLAACAVAYAGLPTSQWGRIAYALLLIVPLGPLTYRLCYLPMAGATVLNLLIASVALHAVLVGLGLAMFGPEGSRTQAIVDASLQFGMVAVTAQGLLVIAGSLALVGLLYALFRHSLIGKALRAAAMNRTGARLVGIPLRLSGEVAMAIGAAIGVVSGALIAPTTTIYYDSGFVIGLKGFVAAIVGGLASYVAASAGALLVGVLESFSSFWASALKEALVFGLVVPFMWWRSAGSRHVEDDQ